MEKVELNGNRPYALPCFLAGLGAGVAVAALFAPRSGAATRSLIGHKVEEGEDWVKAKAAVAQDYVGKQGAALGDRVKAKAERLQSRE